METVDETSVFGNKCEVLENSASNTIIELALTALRISYQRVPRPNNTDSKEAVVNSLPEISLKDVSNHDHCNDCWIVIYDRVYDVTKFLWLHPGGEDIILDYAGRDATFAFRGCGHSQQAIALLRDYLIGELPESERIFRNINGIVSDIPD